MDEDRDTQYFIHVSYVEIYNEEIRDLLSDNPERKLEIKGNAVQGSTNMAYNKTLWLKLMKYEKIIFKAYAVLWKIIISRLIFRIKTFSIW